MHLNHCYAIRYTNVWIRCTCPEKRQLKDQSWQQVQIWSNSRTIFQQSFSAAAGSFNFILFQHRPTQLTNPFRCQSEPFYEVHINVQWTLSTPKKSPKDAKKCILNQRTFLVLFMKVFQIAGLGWLGGSGLATLQGPGLPHPAFSRSRSSRSRSSIDILPSSNGPQSSVEQAFRWRIIIINILITVITLVLVIASLAGEVSHLLEEFTIELTIMPGLTHILLLILCFFYVFSTLR